MILTLLAWAIAARALPGETFGLLILLHATIQAIGRLARLQTWETLVRYGKKASDSRHLQQLFTFGVLVDIVAAMLGLIVVMAAISPLAVLFDIPAEYHRLFMLYACVLPAVIFGPSHQGVLRLFERFDLVALYNAIAPVLRCAGAALLWAGGLGLGAFLAVWGAAIVLARLGLIIMAWRELAHRNLIKGMGAVVRSRSFLFPDTGLLRFSLGSKIIHNLDLTTGALPVLFVGALLGPQAAGIYKVAEQLASLISKGAQKLLAPAIYPAMAEDVSNELAGQRRRATVRASAIAGGAGLIVFLFLAATGHVLLTWIFGPAYSQAYYPMLALALAGVIASFAFALVPALSASGCIARLIACRGGAVAVYCVAIIWLVSVYELTGAGIAMVVYQVTNLILLAIGLKCATNSGKTATDTDKKKWKLL